MWTTGTAYRYKTPNLVHKELTGDPIPPVQFRARGGSFIGKDESSTTFDGSFDPEDDQYVHEYGNEYDTLNTEALNQSDVDEHDVNEIKWSIVRDIGKRHPTVLEQLDQFAPGATSLDVPWQGNRKVRFYDDDGNSFLKKPETTPPDAEDVDIVLLNGGTNDIDLGWLMDFSKHAYNDVVDAIEKYCYRHQKHLLEKTRERFPNALVVLVGYPIFLSEWTSYPKARQYLKAFRYDFAKQLVGRLKTYLLIERVVDGGLVFARAHQHYMRKAVAERSQIEAREGHPGVMYVSRGFGVINAFEGPAPWGWGQSNDDTYDRREHFVLDLVEPKTDLGLPELKPKMLSAAIGHPNRKGSKKTAAAIVDRYRDRGNLSVGETAGKIDRNEPASQRPRSLKDSLSSYDLIPNSFGDPDTGSVLNALSHRYVDSIQLRFYRGTEFWHANRWQRMWRTKHLAAGVDLYLEIEPSRNGNMETFRIDYESDKNAKDTPQFDRHSGKDGRDRFPDDDLIVTEVNIDPMAGRQMNGTVNTNYEEDRSYKEDNVKDDSQGWDISWSSTSYGDENDVSNDRKFFLPENRWDTDRLMLWQLRNATIRANNPGFWALRRIDFTINGELTWTTRWTKHGDLEKTFKKATRKNWTDLRFEVFP